MTSGPGPNSALLCTAEVARKLGTRSCLMFDNDWEIEGLEAAPTKVDAGIDPCAVATCSLVPSRAIGPGVQNILYIHKTHGQASVRSAVGRPPSPGKY
jgi:hypothetical protein